MNTAPLEIGTNAWKASARKARNMAPPSCDLGSAERVAVETTPLAGCVLGFGDIWEGDEAFGCCVVDALLQENLPENVQLAYCGRHFRGVEAWLHQAQRAHIVLGARTGGRPGRTRVSDLEGWSAARFECDRLHTVLARLEQALCRLRLIDGEPGAVRIHVVPVTPRTGLGMTKEMLRAARATVRAILDDLSEAGVYGERPAATDRLYRSEVLNVTF